VIERPYREQGARWRSRSRTLIASLHALLATQTWDRRNVPLPCRVYYRGPRSIPSRLSRREPIAELTKRELYEKLFKYAQSGAPFQSPRSQNRPLLNIQSCSNCGSFEAAISHGSDPHGLRPSVTLSPAPAAALRAHSNDWQGQSRKCPSRRSVRGNSTAHRG
jgi:hypothetical protein